MEHIAWPIAALFFGLAFLLIFRGQIGGFILRVRSVSRDGVSAQSLPEQRSIEQQTDSSTRKEIQTLLQSFDSPALLDQERLITSDLESRKLDSTSDTTKVLVRHLAKSQILLGCELVYRLIFGSQIFFLKKLNSSSGISEEDAEEFYGAVAKQHNEAFQPDQHKRYFSFLVRQGLAVFNDGEFFITDFGREFLSWIVQSGVDENRPL